MKSNFKIYRSSAGSGKTHALAYKYVFLSLQLHKNHFRVDYYKKILAITFTNKAVSEMKDRILAFLFSLSQKKDEYGLLKNLQEDSQLEKEVIYLRSSQVYSHILHNYSSFSISTIDTFTYRIVKTFSYDLGLAFNFDLVMDDDQIINPVVNSLLSNASKTEKKISNVLVNFTLEKVKLGKSIDIEGDLQEFSKQLFKEDLIKYLDNKTLDIGQFDTVNKYIQNNKKITEDKIKILSDEVKVYMKTHSLEKNYFINGTFYNHFVKNLSESDDKKWIPTISLKKNIDNDIWYPKSRAEEIKYKIDSSKKDLIVFYNNLIKLLCDYNSYKAISNNIFSIALINELIKHLNVFKKKNNIEHISSFNKKIHEIVSNQTALYIYERLGERYSHFLIDEFQDTSVLQWQNLLPLITDSIDYGESLIVGDGKQSIYRWRGGEVEQFLKLPDIHQSEKLSFSNEWKTKLEYHYCANNLDVNYRSKQEIVQFNNLFFEKLKPLLSTELSNIYDGHDQHCNDSELGGYVRIELFSDDDNNYKDLILERIYLEVNKLINIYNYSLSDICILCNSKKTVGLVAKFLSFKSIPVISDEGLLIKNSEKVDFIFSFLLYINNPNNIIAKSAIVCYLHKHILFDISLNELTMKAQKEDGFAKILNKANITLDFNSLSHNSLYELVNQLIIELNLKMDSYLEFFLEVIYKYIERENSSLSLFINWWNENKDKEAISIPDGIDAIQLMTIHKSKGLAFKVVMIPFNWQDASNKNEIWIDTSKYFENQLPLSLIRTANYLKYSLFSKEYNKEKDLQFLDSMNKLYVAMTRAKERLYLFSKEFPKKVTNDFVFKGYLNSFLYQFSDSYPITYGKEDFKNISENVQKKYFNVKSFTNNNWKKLITLKNSAIENKSEINNEKLKEWGQLFHKVLSKIYYVEDKEKAINFFCKKGEVKKGSLEKLNKVIDSLFSDHKILKYFDKKWLVRTECEILSASGKINIPDRLLFDKKSKKIIIVDFKTGERSSDHNEQITKYANILESMGYKVIEKVLIYTEKQDKIKLV